MCRLRLSHYYMWTTGIRTGIPKSSRADGVLSRTVTPHRRAPLNYGVPNGLTHTTRQRREQKKRKNIRQSNAPLTCV